MIRLLLSTCLVLTLSSCLYKMPGEDDFSTVPMTNNPHVTHDPGQSLIPGMGK